MSHHRISEPSRSPSHRRSRFSSVTFIFLLSLLTLSLVASCGEKKPTEPAEGACLGSDGEPLPVAPESERVDLAKPVFTNPISVTNTLFPASIQHSYVMTGLSDGLPFRTEVTLLPGTRAITIDGVSVNALISQYCAFLDNEIHEVAIDWYAQDNTGAVWYLGEDVFNYEGGEVADLNGTWLAGNEGPAAMIMPASPKVGDVYRPENACGIVFEEVTVKSIGVSVTGPTGTINGAIIVEELHMDGTTESKTFAPGYGEFSTGAGNNLEAMAVAVPTDALATAVPTALVTITDACTAIFNAAATGDWTAVNTSLTSLNTAWTNYQAGQLPPRLRTQFENSRFVLTGTVAAMSSSETREAAIEVARAAYDFRLRYQPPTQIDLARFRLWLQQTLVDVQANDPASIKGDVTILEWTRDRFVHTLSSSNASQLNTKLAALRSAAGSNGLPTTKTAAEDLLSFLNSL